MLTSRCIRSLLLRHCLPQRSLLTDPTSSPPVTPSTPTANLSAILGQAVEPGLFGGRMSEEGHSGMTRHAALAFYRRLVGEE